MPTDLPPSPTLERETLMKRAGRSVMGFSRVLLLGSIGVSIAFDVLTVDLTSLFFYFLGASTAAGNRRSATWAIGVSIYYLLAATAMLVATWVGRSPISFQSKGPLRDDHVPWWMAALAIGAIWSAVNIRLLVRARRTHT